MESEKALRILSSLANGIHPSTGEVFDLDSPYQSADVVRALYAGLNALEKTVPKEKRRRGLPANAGKPWTREEDERLLQLFDQGHDVNSIADRFERTPPGIAARLERHGRLQTDGGQWRKGVNLQQGATEPTSSDRQT